MFYGIFDSDEVTHIHIYTVIIIPKPICKDIYGI